MDNRLRHGNIRIVDEAKYHIDENVTASIREKLGEERFAQLMNVINVQFPEQDNGHKLYSEEVSIRLTKVTNHRENLRFRVDLRGPDIDKLDTVLSDLLSIGDLRQFETNQRDLAAEEILKSYTYDDLLALQMVLDVLYYRAQPGEVLKKLHAEQQEKRRLESMGGIVPVVVGNLEIPEGGHEVMMSNGHLVEGE